MIERPIAHDLDSTPDEPRLHAAWRGVRDRVGERRRARRTRLVGGVALAAAVALGVGLLAWPMPETGPLRHADGEPLNAAESIAEPRALRLTDDSTIELDTGARIEPVRNDGERVELLLTRGRARFEVTPGGPRRWVIDGGFARVEVVGTAFVVERDERSLSVEVEHGRVRVIGDEVDRSLGAGEHIAIEAPVRAAIDSVPPPPAEAPPEETGPPTVQAPEPRETTAPSVSPAPATGEDPSELLRSADLARREGRMRDAIAPLEAVLRDHPDHAEAPLAAITLARIQLTLDDSAGALRSLRLARRLGVPRLFDAEVCASMAMVLDATGNREGARSEASACLGRHGTPPHLEELRRLVDAP
ncbi:MAG: FecR domain-containing protein [Deltaproteobacteria bacterium]|nr:FecR domain-containing protein [Deltaproteobacteria bacterium]